MKSIIEKYREWKKELSEEYIYDECHEIFNVAKRGEVLEVLEFLDLNYKEEV